MANPLINSGDAVLVVYEIRTWGQGTKKVGMLSEKSPDLFIFSSGHFWKKVPMFFLLPPGEYFYLITFTSPFFESLTMLDGV